MFTGLVEEVGTLQGVHRGSNSAILTIGARTVLEGTKVGDSIMTNGVCLTVTELGATYFSADVMHETLDRSGLGSLAPGSRVNLERAMAANGRFGGHIVSGHIDGTGTIAAMENEGNATWVYIRTSSDILALIVEKGSIAIDGISLTVAKVEATRFAVSLIPHTQEETTLHANVVGDVVNIETDIIAKYVEKLMVTNDDDQTDKTELYRRFMKHGK